MFLIIIVWHFFSLYNIFFILSKLLFFISCKTFLMFTTIMLQYYLQCSRTVVLLEDLRISLLNFNFFMIYITHKILALLKNYLNYLKDNILESFSKKYNRLLFFFKKTFFFITYNHGKSKA